MDLDKLTENRPLLIGAIAIGLLLIIGGIVAGIFALNQQTATASPTPIAPFEGTVELPQSLDELIAEYPELADVLSDRSIDTIYKDFLIAYEEGGIAAAEQLARERGLLNERDQIRMTLVVDSPENVPAVEDELASYGVFVEGSYANEINIAIPIRVLEAFSQTEGDLGEFFAQLRASEHVVRIKLPLQSQPSGYFFQSGGGAFTTEGVAITGADQWHAAGLTGQEVRVGVLDFGFAGYSRLLGSDLPATVETFTAASGATAVDDTSEVHGTACAEIIYDMAPGVQLYLAHYDGSLVSQSIAVDWLLSQGVQIISHSGGSNYGPVNGTGPQVAIVENVTSQGVLWVNASGNEAESHFRAQFNDSTGDGFHNFPDGQNVMPILAYADYIQIIMNWDDWDNLNQDYDLHLFDSSGQLLASSAASQTGAPGDEAAEFLIFGGFPAGTVLYVGIEAYDTTTNNIIDIFVYPGEVAYPAPEHSLASPGDAPSSFTVGATELNDSIASYSSQGPTNDGRIKPDISAPAGVSTVSYGRLQYDGTSAATPHVAGAAALVWAANPTFTAAEVQNFLATHAIDLGPPGVDPIFGFGRLNLPSPTQGGGQQVDPPPQLPTPAPLPTIVPTPAPPTDFSSSGDGDLEVLFSLVGLLLLCTVCLTCGGGVLLFGGIILLFMRPGRKRRNNLKGQNPGGSPKSHQKDDDAKPTTRFHIDPNQFAAAPIATTGEFRLVINGNAIMLPTDGITVGRAPNNSLPIPEDDLISRQHAEVVRMGGSWVIRDRGSANGTFVNGQRITHHVLNSGDQILIGRTSFQFG